MSGSRRSPVGRRYSSRLRAGLLGAAGIATALFLWVQTVRNEPILQFSRTFDFFVLGLIWVGLLYWLGYIRDAPSAGGHDLVRSLDNLDWHLDAVRERGLPEHRAANVGGPMLLWLSGRGFAAGASDKATAVSHGLSSADLHELYERCGGKLVTSSLPEHVVAFCTSYMDPRSGAYFDDLEAILGADIYAVDISGEQLDSLLERITQRFSAQMEETG